MSAARFLLEFEATGDQEVVNAIREVGTAGKETAAELESLSGIEDPFAAVGAGAESAVQPLTEVGTATGELGGIFTEAGSASEEFGGALTGMNTEIEGVSGGLTDANTVVGEFGEAATGAGTSATTAMGGIGQMSGAIVGLGGTIGTAVSTIFRMQDAQLSLDKANFKVTKSTETARKASVAFDTLLKSATSNTDAIAQARDRLSEAQDNLNKLQEAGVTSGAEYEAAQAAVTSATAALRAEFAAGGGDANKFDAAINKLGTTQEAQELATRNAEKATREFGQTQLETGLAVAGLVGSTVQAVSSLKGIKEGATKVVGPLKQLAGGLAEGKKGTEGLTTALENSVGIAAIVVSGYKAIEVVLASVETAMAQISGEASKAVEGQIKVLEAGKSSSVGGYIDLIDKIFGTTDALKKSLPQIKADEAAKKKSEQASKTAAAGEKELGDAAKTTAADFAAAVSATNGNTTAMAALQRTNKQAQITQADFNAALNATKAEMDSGGTSTDTLTQSMYKFYGAMQQTTGQALELSNLFPQMGANIQNALLGQEQGMDVAVKLWDDFKERVKAGQYEVGEFTKYIQDMGYALPPAIQAGVDKITELAAATDSVTVSSKGAAAGVGILGTASADVSNTVGKLANAVTDMNQSLIEQEYTLRASITGLRDLGNQSKGVSNALLEVTNNFEKSNQALREAQAVRDSATASSEKLHTALNNELTALIEQEAKLKANIAASEDAAIQRQALSNAYLEGEAAARTWIASLDEEAAKEQANLSTLEAYASQFGQLPGVIEPTADAMQGFIAANEQGGQAALDFAHQVSSAYDDMLGEAGGMVDELAAIIQKGGDDMHENLDKWFEDLPEMVKEHLTDAQVAALQGIAEFQAAVNTTATEFEVDWMTQGFAQAKSDLSRNLGDMKKIFAKDFPEVFAVAQDIISHGSEQAVSKMVEIFKGAAKKPPQVILQELQALSGTIPGTMANAAGTMPGTLDPAAKETGKSAAITLSEEFAAAGTHIASVVSGMGANMSGLASIAKSAGQSAAVSLSEGFSAAGTHIAAVMRGISQSIKTGLGGAQGAAAKGITLQLNIAPAMQQLKSLKTQIGALKQAKPIQILLNIQPAVTAANRIKSIVNALPNIKRTITYTYRIVGSKPNPQNINRTITYRYRTVGTKPAAQGMHENLAEDTLIQAHKGERVDITPGGGFERTAIMPGGGNRSRGGGSEFVIPITLKLDDKVLMRHIQRGLMEDVGGVS